MRARHAVPLLASMLALPGCSLFHSNISGGFACAAPRGNCAPSMTIDDGAIRAIGGMTPDHDPLPASSSPPPSLDPRLPRPALRVVYPASRDPSGQLHPRAVAYIAVDAGFMAQADQNAFAAGGSSDPHDSSLLAIAEIAPDQSVVASAASIPPQVVGNAPKASTIPAAIPSATTQAAQAPLDAIRAQVKTILSGAGTGVAGQRAPVPAPVAGLGQAPAKAAAIFPPQGS